MAIDDYESFLIGVSPDMSKIRNSKGNWWEVAGSNVQVAIDDLFDVNGGTVWVGGDVSLSSHLSLEDNVNIDFLGNRVSLNGDTTFALGENTKNASVKNVTVDPSSSQSNPIIHLRTPTNGGGNDIVESNEFENIYVESGNYAHDLIVLEIQQATGIPKIRNNTFKNIFGDKIKTGIRLKMSGNNGIGHSNYFENINPSRHVIAVWFDVPTTATDGFTGNIFQKIQTQCDSNTLYGIRDISKKYNHFDHCIIWDWYTHGGSNPYDWIVRIDAEMTYINAMYIVELDDQGTNTIISCGIF